MEAIDLDQSSFDRIRQLVYERSGIALSDRKVALVRTRLGKRLRALGCIDFKTYLERLAEDESGEEVVQLLDAISTNVTQFFREPQHFDLIMDVVSKWWSGGQRKFRFWSAACATGEEPYSLAMTLRETLGGDHLCDVRILATDISTRALHWSQCGWYRATKVAGISHEWLKRYFTPEFNGRDDGWRVKDCLRQMITFRHVNLSAPPLPMRGPFDIILLRNVMIYFDDSVRRRLLQEAHRLLRTGGYLLVGHAESLTGMVSPFKLVSPSVYTKT